MALKLKQGQIWTRSDAMIRIVRVERLAVGYKAFKDGRDGESEHQNLSKKEFCRLLKRGGFLEEKARAKSPISLPTAQTNLTPQEISASPVVSQS